MKPRQLSKRDWDALTHKQKERRLRALRALRSMREGESLTRVTKEMNISPETFRRHVGKVITKKKGRWKARKTDRISRKMTIFTKGRMMDIKIEDSRTASVIGRYGSAVAFFRQFGNTSNLKEFEGMTAKDVFGNTYTLETRPKKIVQILDAIEEPDVPVVYAT